MLPTKTVVADESLQTGVTSLRCDFGPLFFKVFKSWRFLGSLLWTLIFFPQTSSWIPVRWLAGPLEQLYFLSLNPAEFPGLWVWDHCRAEMSTLVLFSSSWQTVFIQECLGTFLHSFSYIWILPVSCAEKQPQAMMFPAPNFTVGLVFLGWWAICPPNMVCIGLWLLVYGEMMSFPLPGFGPNRALWSIQRFRNPSPVSVVCLATIRLKRSWESSLLFLVWHCGNETPFCRSSVGIEPADINLRWQGSGLLSNYWLISPDLLAFHAFWHLSLCMCSKHFLCDI